MPTYTYRCSACGKTFDKVQRITEDAVKTCDLCGAEAASRLITSGNFMLKGSGWYSDAYSGSSNKKADAAPAPAASKPAGEGAAAPAAAAATTTAAPSAPAASAPSSGTPSSTPSSSTPST